MVAPPITLLVACSAAKASPPQAVARPDTTADDWRRTLDGCRRDHTPRNLYRGQPAAAVRAGADLLEPLGVRVLIVSAGWGLIGLDEPIASYDATFSGPDAVGDPAGWWQVLTRHAGLSIADLGGTVVAALSPSYLAAVAADLARHPSVVRVAAGGPGAADLTLAAAEVTRRLGGGRVSANARLGAHVTSRLTQGWRLEQVRGELLLWEAGGRVQRDGARTPVGASPDR